jgi:hypothetical protein
MNALESSVDLLSATLNKDINPKDKILNTIKRTLKGEDLIVFETFRIILIQLGHD